MNQKREDLIMMIYKSIVPPGCIRSDRTCRSDRCWSLNRFIELQGEHPSSVFVCRIYFTKIKWATPFFANFHPAHKVFRDHQQFSDVTWSNWRWERRHCIYLSWIMNKHGAVKSSQTRVYSCLKATAKKDWWCSKTV